MGNIIIRKYINVTWKIYSPSTLRYKLEFENKNELKAVEVDGWIKVVPARKAESDCRRTETIRLKEFGEGPACNWQWDWRTETSC
jgi:hypothetical protein